MNERDDDPPIRIPTASLHVVGRAVPFAARLVALSLLSIVALAGLRLGAIFVVLPLSWLFRGVFRASPPRLLRDVEIDRDGVRAAGERIARVDDLASAWVVPGAEPTAAALVRLTTSRPLGRIVDLEVADRTVARAIVERLLRGPAHARLTVDLPSRLALYPRISALCALVPVVAVVAVVASVRTGPSVEFVVLMSSVIAVLATLFVALSPTRVEIAGEGLRARWLFGARWFPFASIDSVERVGRALVFRLHDRASVQLPARALASPAGRRDEAAVTCAIVEERIAHALELDHAHVGFAGLDELPLSLDAARAAVTRTRARIADATSFRVEASSAGALLSALESPRNNAQSRAIAAVALFAMLRAESSARTRERIARLADASMNRALSDLLRAGLRGDDASVDAAAAEMLSTEDDALPAPPTRAERGP